MKTACLLVATLICLTMSSPSLALPPEHFKAKYVPWGVDEYELFGLTPTELSSKFEGKLRFEENYTHAYMRESNNGPQFLIKMAGGRVCGVRRMFIDGEGCNILGPELPSKQAALEFSIDGLSKLKGAGDKEDLKRLADAQEQLKKLKGSQKANVQNPGKPKTMK